MFETTNQIYSYLIVMSLVLVPQAARASEQVLGQASGSIPGIPPSA